jgi:hypothetical protein
MRWLVKLIRALAAFWGVFQQVRVQEQQAAQQAQDVIVQETQEKQDAVHDKTDDELRSDAESLGLVQPEGPGRAQ